VVSSNSLVMIWNVWRGIVFSLRGSEIW
jgi:hypothetical protein